MCYQIKTEHPKADLGSILEKNKDAITGEKTGKNSVALSKLYYDHSIYTKAGLFSGGIQFNEKKITSQDIIKATKELISVAIQPDLKFANIDLGDLKKSTIIKTLELNETISTINTISNKKSNKTLGK